MHVHGNLPRVHDEATVLKLDHRHCTLVNEQLAWLALARDAQRARSTPIRGASSCRSCEYVSGTDLNETLLCERQSRAFMTLGLNLGPPANASRSYRITDMVAS